MDDKLNNRIDVFYGAELINPPSKEMLLKWHIEKLVLINKEFERENRIKTILIWIQIVMMTIIVFLFK
jgi:hypothetical protein